MLLTCPECGNETSSHATSCPGCGYPIKDGESLAITPAYVGISAIPRQVMIPAVLKWIGGTVLVVNAAIISLAVLAGIIDIFEHSLGAGLAIAFFASPVFFIPLGAAWGGIGWVFEGTAGNYWELLGKGILKFGAVILGSWIVYWVLFGIIALVMQ